jgi:hypothetical protein
LNKPLNRKEFSLGEFDETLRIILESGGEFRFYPKGTSMLPLIVQGRDSAVIVKPKGEIRKGDIVLYLRDDGHYVFHRAVEVTADDITMCGDNQLNLEKGIRRNQVIAVADRLYRGEKQVSFDSFSYRLYCFLWRSFFVRRVFFKLRRLKNGR